MGLLSHRKHLLTRIGFKYIHFHITYYPFCKEKNEQDYIPFGDVVAFIPHPENIKAAFFGAFADMNYEGGPPISTSTTTTFLRCLFYKTES